MASYPNSIKTFTAKIDGVDIVHAADVNDPQAEITAIETELGTLPKGTKSDVKTRLDDVDTRLDDAETRLDDAEAILTDLQPQVANIALLQPAPVGGRLTLESGEPISIADQLAKSTVYYTPYIHNRIALYNNTASKWQMFSLAEKSLDISAANANTNYDIFLDYNSGNPTLRSLAWTNASTRATALVRQDGVLVKSGAPAQRYLGTFRTTDAAGKTEDSLAKRFLWNMYNRVPRLGGIDEATNHTYNSSTWRQWNNTPTLTEFVIGQRMTIAASARANIKIDNTAYSAKFAIVKDSAVIVASNFDYSMTLTTNTISTWSTIEFKTQCEVGYHYINVLEQVSTGGNGTFSEVITYLLLIE